MKKTNRIYLSPDYASEKCLAYFTDVIDTKNDIVISVPQSFKGILICDGKITRRMDTCDNVDLKEYIDLTRYKTIQILYVYRGLSAKVSFGFGNISCDLVYDTEYELTQGYLVGANGSYNIRVYDYALFMGAFSGFREVTTASIRERINVILRGLGTRILPVYLNEINASYENLGACVEDFSNIFTQRAINMNETNELGVSIENLTIDGIIANER